jgi:hypothetical protein
VTSLFQRSDDDAISVKVVVASSSRFSSAVVSVSAPTVIVGLTRDLYWGDGTVVPQRHPT